MNKTSFPLIFTQVSFQPVFIYSISLFIFVALLWTLSNRVSSFLCWEPESWMAWQHQPSAYPEGMYVIRFNRLVAIQLHQMVPNLFFIYSGEGLYFPHTPSEYQRHLRKVWLPVKTEEKTLLSTTAFYISVIPVHSSCLLGGVHSPWPFFFFLTYAFTESLLVILHIPCQVVFPVLLCSPDSISTI